MLSGPSDKNYFLRQKSRIMGPFSILKLTAMYRSGLLNCEDMVSKDKKNWQYINVLFPGLGPGLPGVVRTPCCENTSPGQAEPTTEDRCPPRAEQVCFSQGQRKPLPAETAEETLPPFQEWIADIGRTFALIWNFQEILRNHMEKAPRFYGIAIVIHGILSSVFVLLFGKYFSSNYHIVFSPLKGVGLAASLCAAASLIGFLAARNCTPAGRKTSGSWQMCAAGIFMDYGLLGCCTLALAHGMQHVWVRLLLFFIDSMILCSCAMQMRDYLKANCKPWKIPVICIVLLWNPAAAAFIYYFEKLI